MGAISRPHRDYLSFFWLTRQFLPVYFHSPLPGLDRVYHDEIPLLQKQVNTPESLLRKAVTLL